jgi:DNA-directed RNA polymerase subunit RPC12/RpoP
MKVVCPDCKEPFDISPNEYDEGDDVECPECGMALIVEVKNGRLAVITEKAKYYDEELDEYFSED